MIRILGGIITPITELVAVTAIVISFSYPSLIIEGIRRDPMAEVSEVDDPVIPPKNIETNTFTWAKPPLKEPTKISEKSINLFAIDDLFINSPASMNKGIASKGNESRPVNIFCAIIMTDTSGVKKTHTRAAMPIAIAIGIFSRMEIIKATNDSDMMVISK